MDGRNHIFANGYARKEPYLQSMLQLTRRCRMSRSFARKCKFLICLLLLISVTKFYYDYTSWEYDESYGEITGTINPDLVIIEKICSTVSDACYSVVDMLESNGLIRRAIYTLGFEKDFESLVSLISPKGLSFQESDTRMWKVDHKAILSQYVAAMILEPMMLTAIGMEIDRDESTNILIIGLGGGSMDMFFHKQKPKINITVIEIDPVIRDLAHKWFGVENNDRRRTMIADGVKFIRESAKNGHKFDAVFIDACDVSREMPCPAKVFLEDEVLDDAKSCLKMMGALILNVLPLKNEVENVSKVRAKLLSKFPTCLSMSMSSELNTVFACVNYSLEKDSFKTTYDLIQQRFRELVLRYNFHPLMKDVKFSLLN